MPSHTLDANPDKCAACKPGVCPWGDECKSAGEHEQGTSIYYAREHAAAQDAAMCRAWRAAAGTENPVTWLTASALYGHHEQLRLADKFAAMAVALRREIGGTPQ